MKEIIEKKDIVTDFVDAIMENRFARPKYERGMLYSNGKTYEEELDAPGRMFGGQIPMTPNDKAQFREEQKKLVDK